MRGTYLHQLVERTNPLKRAEDEDNLQQSGNPRLTGDEQNNQNQRSNYTD